MDHVFLSVSVSVSRSVLDLVAKFAPGIEHRSLGSFVSQHVLCSNSGSVCQFENWTPKWKVCATILQVTHSSALSLCCPMCDICTFVEIRVASGWHGSEHDFYVCFLDYLVSDLIFFWCFFCRAFVILLVGSIAKQKSKRVM
jgi:hypothetical protein